MDDQIRYYQAKLQYEIDPWDLNEALERGDRIVLVDTRSPEVYGRSHIPAAMNIPYRTMRAATTAHRVAKPNVMPKPARGRLRVSTTSSGLARPLS